MKARREKESSHAAVLPGRNLSLPHWAFRSLHRCSSAVWNDVQRSLEHVGFLDLILKSNRDDASSRSQSAEQTVVQRGY